MFHVGIVADRIRRCGASSSSAGGEYDNGQDLARVSVSRRWLTTSTRARRSEDLFAEARLNLNASLITGTVCGVRVEDVEDPLMQKIRYLDKLVDELAKGRAMEKILRA